MRRESGIRNMTEGSALRHIVWFTLPLLAGNFLQQFYNMVDSWVVGNYVSDAALAAVGVGFPVIFLFTSLFSGIATGGTVVIAQALGAQKPERVQAAIGTLYTAFVRGILPITAAAVLLVRPLMVLLRVDPAAWAETRTYLLVVCAGIIGSIGYNLNAGILSGVGNSSATLLFLAVSTILNILLDLTLGWGLIALGGLVAYENVIMRVFGDVMWRWGQNNPVFRAFYLMLDELPQIVTCVALIVCGLWLVRGPKGKKVHRKKAEEPEDEDFREYTAAEADAPEAPEETADFAMPKLSALLGDPVTPEDLEEPEQPENAEGDDGRTE